MLTVGSAVIASAFVQALDFQTGGVVAFGSVGSHVYSDGMAQDNVGRTVA